MRVLIADDSRAMRMIILRTLRQTGLVIDDVLEVADVPGVLTEMIDFRPDLILSDWNMPGMSGIELLELLRQNGDMTPFGFITVESSPAMRERAIDAGAAFLLVKPFDVERLGEMVRDVVEDITVPPGGVRR
jgi:two-component system chemotaxis response regulator CheY